MNTRLNYTVTPDLTFEFYGEPFVATGSYSDVREVSATPATLASRNAAISLVVIDRTFATPWGRLV